MGSSLSTPCHNKTVKQRRFLHVETHTFWFHVIIIQPSYWDCVSKRARLSPQACSRSELDFSVLMYPLPLEPCYNPWSWLRTMLQSDPNGAQWPSSKDFRPRICVWFRDKQQGQWVQSAYRVWIWQLFMTFMWMILYWDVCVSGFSLSCLLILWSHEHGGSL